MSCDLYTSGAWNTIHFWLTQKITLVLNGKKEKERLHLSHPLPTPLLPGWHSALGDHAGFPRTSLEIWLAILFQCCFLIGWKSEIWSAVLFKCGFLIGWEKDAIYKIYQRIHRTAQSSAIQNGEIWQLPIVKITYNLKFSLHAIQPKVRPLSRSRDNGRVVIRKTHSNKTGRRRTYLDHKTCFPREHSLLITSSRFLRSHH